MAISRRTYLLAVALMVGVLLASTGAAVGQQQGQDNTLRKPESPVGSRFAPPQTRVRAGTSCPESGLWGSTKV
jgi:hypothetical protein